MPPGTEEVLAHLDPLTLTAQIVALLIVAGVLVKALSWLVPVVRGVRATVDRAHNVIDVVLGSPEERDDGGFVTKPAQPGIAVQLGRTIGRLEKIEYHIKANGGESAYDQHTKKLDANTKLLQELHEIVTTVALKQAMQSEEQSRQGEDLTNLRKDYRRALEHNHPDYDPGQFGDRFTD